MNEMPIDDGGHGASLHDRANPAGLDAAGWLCLAATPCFTIMALVTGMAGGGQMQMMDHFAHAASPINGMALMYLLMAVFHAPPWLRWIRRRGTGAP